MYRVCRLGKMSLQEEGSPPWEVLPAHSNAVPAVAACGKGAKKQPATPEANLKE